MQTRSVFHTEKVMTLLHGKQTSNQHGEIMASFFLFEPHNIYLLEAIESITVSICPDKIERNENLVVSSII